eukprot:CAMPEP_0119096794 /NCGR_PEP_ID=MMETSP1178-20130426/173970_1 /TAXON_ID=33656 /ORGANISM="unid sp, Strain CCMP2000" /LENGTH=158 /DNA_ID=CAMNT_0007080697 /DNA_START=27 /DNA_END=503 /DNA_ORIENTATION=-
MDALIEKELTHSREVESRVKRAPPPTAPRPSKESKCSKRKATRPKPEPEPKEVEDWAEDGEEDEEDDEFDEELAENGSFTPVVVTDPRSDAEAKSMIDRRVFLDGVPRRSDLRCSGATICGWRAKKRQWEVECDRHDEHILVSSSCMFFIDLVPSPKP